MSFLLVAFATFVTLHRPGGHNVAVNTREVTALTAPHDHGHFAAGVKCIVHTSGRSVYQVIETCDVVEKMLHRRAAG